MLAAGYDGAAAVVPYIGTWIETIIMWRNIEKEERRTLYRYVDWNLLR